MSQCINHEAFTEIALGFGWTLWEYGQDSTCEHHPEQVLIWIQPCAWDQSQQVPVGCLCCTDLDLALTWWHGELHSVLESKLGRMMVNPFEGCVTPALAPPVPTSFLAPYQAR